MKSLLTRLVQHLRTVATLPAEDLLRDAVYRRLWTSCWRRPKPAAIWR